MPFIRESDIVNLSGKNRSFVSDLVTPNLYVRLGRKKVFYWRARREGKIVCEALGEFPKMSLAVARNLAEQRNKEGSFSGRSVIEVLDEFCAINPRANVRAFVKYALPKFGTREIERVKRGDILDVIDPIYKKGYVTTAKMIFNIAKRLLRHAVIRGYMPHSVLGEVVYGDLYAQPNVTHLRAITEPQRLKEFVRTIVRDKPSLKRSCVLFSLYVALRSSTVRNIEWRDVDIEGARLLIPREKMKGREVFVVPLSSSALRILRESPKQNGRIFPFKAGLTLNNYIRSLGFGDTVFHGLRSTFATLCYENMNLHGHSSDIIELCLDHRERNVVKAAYNRGERMDSRRALMQWWSDYLDNLISNTS